MRDLLEPPTAYTSCFLRIYLFARLVLVLLSVVYANPRMHISFGFEYSRRPSFAVILMY